MTVQELISLLNEVEPTLEVVVPGYEDGFDDVIALLLLDIDFNVNSEEYYGRHALSARGAGKKGVFLRSNRRS